MRATNTFASCSHGSKALPCPKRRSSRLVSIKHSREGADAEFRRDESVQSGERIITVYPARLLNLGRSCKFVQRSSHAKGLRRRACTTSGEVVTKFQSDSSRTDLPVRILYAQPRSRLKLHESQDRSPTLLSHSVSTSAASQRAKQLCRGREEGLQWIPVMSASSASCWLRLGRNPYEKPRPRRSRSAPRMPPSARSCLRVRPLRAGAAGRPILRQEVVAHRRLRVPAARPCRCRREPPALRPPPRVRRAADRSPVWALPTARRSSSIRRHRSPALRTPQFRHLLALSAARCETVARPD